ncbi:hypothetical protein CBR_g16803 [Chara braunii]|uniref:DUF647 domain-containing protein n=1 Tax=Chara braunii TaxID=69332 RepID=A0A388KTS8_CHABU|nr:hypothetical protein CBR_g16803 [Chara braunii]|eukprot:GBG73461.1 hypothetical protein CBR_g16803 [Chara braunii]
MLSRGIYDSTKLPVVPNVGEGREGWGGLESRGGGKRREELTTHGHRHCYSAATANRPLRSKTVLLAANQHGKREALSHDRCFCGVCGAVWNQRRSSISRAQSHGPLRRGNNGGLTECEVGALRQREKQMISSLQRVCRGSSLTRTNIVGQLRQKGNVSDVGLYRPLQVTRVDRRGRSVSVADGRVRCSALAVEHAHGEGLNERGSIWVGTSSVEAGQSNGCLYMEEDCGDGGDSDGGHGGGEGGSFDGSSHGDEGGGEEREGEWVQAVMGNAFKFLRESPRQLPLLMSGKRSTKQITQQPWLTLHAKYMGSVLAIAASMFGLAVLPTAIALTAIPVPLTPKTLPHHHATDDVINTAVPAFDEEEEGTDLSDRENDSPVEDKIQEALLSTNGLTAMTGNTHSGLRGVKGYHSAVEREGGGDQEGVNADKNVDSAEGEKIPGGVVWEIQGNMWRRLVAAKDDTFVVDRTLKAGAASAELTCESMEKFMRAEEEESSKVGQEKTGQKADRRNGDSSGPLPLDDDGLIAFVRHEFRKGIEWAVEGLKGVMLPEGFPQSVSDDYVAHTQWRMGQVAASQVNFVLCTQALLYAVGLGKGAIPTAAAINWVLKDGVGFLSKLILTKYGRDFDENPKSWRFLADFGENIAYGLELMTPTFPHLFVFLGAGAGAVRASSGLIQAATRGCFNASFAAQRNFADVVAKGEAQGMVSKWVGIAIGIAVSSKVGNRGPALWATYLTICALHLYCNMKSYQTVHLRTLNPYRAALAFSHYLHTGQMPGTKEVNREEPLLPKVSFLERFSNVRSVGSTLTGNGVTSDASVNMLRGMMATSAGEVCDLAKAEAYDFRDRLEVGCRLDSIVKSSEEVEALMRLYDGEKYILSKKDDTIKVVVFESATPKDLLKAALQASYIQHVCFQSNICRSGVAAMTGPSRPCHSPSFPVEPMMPKDADDLSSADTAADLRVRENPVTPDSAHEDESHCASALTADSSHDTGNGGTVSGLQQWKKYWPTNAKEGIPNGCREGGILRSSLEFMRASFGEVERRLMEAGWVADGLVVRPAEYRILHLRLGLDGAG